MSRVIDEEVAGRWISRARRYARSVCRDHPGWDAGDLEGTILLDCVRWPPEDDKALSSRCRSSTNDWFRRRLGRNLDYPTTERMETLDTVMSDGEGDEFSLFDLVPEEVDMDDEIVARSVRDAADLILQPRDATILRMFWEGWSQREIADVVGVTESRISQLLNGRIARTMQRWLSLPAVHGSATNDGDGRSTA